MGTNNQGAHGLSVAEVNNHSIGNLGSVTETGTTALTGKNFFAITMLADTVFDTLTDATGTGDPMVAISLPAGLTIFGDFTAVTLTSGVVRCYNGIART